jgi:uncharacterized protein YjbI with pentapeptide repeats
MIAIANRHNHALPAALVVGALMFVPARTSHGDTETPRVKLGRWAGKLEAGPGMNAVGRHLRGSQFVGQDLRGAVFDGCDLYGVRFYQSDLSGASFQGAHMTGMILGDCKLDGADFTDAIINGITSSGSQPDLPLSARQFMSTRSYKRKDLSNCVIWGFDGGKHAKRKYDFRGANLHQVTIVGGDFTESDFTNADIPQIRLEQCAITFAQLASTRTFQERLASGMVISSIRVEGKADFSRFWLMGSELTGTFEEVDFTGANIARARLGRIMTTDRLRSTWNYRRGDLTGIAFMGADLSGCDFSRQNLTDCTFRGCNLTGAPFNDAVITNAKFSPHAPNTGLTAEQIKSTWNYKHGRMGGIQLPDAIANALQED